MEMYKSAEALISILNAHGVDKIFLNPGFEFIDVLTGVAKARTGGDPSPQLVLCLDESVTASAAYGNYMVTGKPQVIMVHSELGTHQLGGNVQNLQWGRVPAVILAACQDGDPPRLTWTGQPFDQGGILRNSVKFDRRLKGDEDLHEALAEAFQIACSEPTGPVYLCFPMNYLYGEIAKPQGSPAGRDPIPLPAADEGELGKIADMLLAAKKPLLVSGNAGRYPQNVAALVSLAETIGAQVITGYSWMNFPSGHPLCLGIEQIGGSRKRDAGYDEADVILAIDYAMPYVGSAPPPLKEAKILHIDVDPLTQGRVLWGRGADIFIKADSRIAIPALEKLLKEKITPAMSSVISGRISEISEKTCKTRESWKSAAAAQQGADTISPDYLCYCINRAIGEGDIVVNHTLTHCASPTEQIDRTLPGTWFGCPSGAIGWAPGAALGAASASPGKTVVAIMTDGGFIWGCPTSALWTSANYGFPYLTVICNNNGYGAIRDVQLGMLGEKNPSAAFAAESAVNFRPDYAMIAQGAGAYGRIVKRSDEVAPAIEQALEAVRGGKPAVLDVWLS